MDFPNEKIIQADADVRVYNPGVSTTSHRPEGLRMETLGEIILGKFETVEAWPEMSGATFKVVHNSTITLYPPDADKGWLGWDRPTHPLIPLPGEALSGIALLSSRSAPAHPGWRRRNGRYPG